MVLAVLILVFTGIGSLKACDLKGCQESDLSETALLKRVKRVDSAITVKDKFPTRTTVPCDSLHMTDEAPFTAIILYQDSGRLLCMGSIIDVRHVLSAKKCYEKTDYNDLKVLVGYLKAYWGNHAQVKYVKQILRHEYEIVILRLDEGLTFTPYVQSVRLATSNTKKVEEFTNAYPAPYIVVGFMVDRFDLPGDLIEKDQLYTLKANDFVGTEECKKDYPKAVLDANKVFCSNGNATFCWGGWGAPVLKWVQSTYFLQIGVVISDSCTANVTGPLLAARTDAYTEWIRGNSHRGQRQT